MEQSCFRTASKDRGRSRVRNGREETEIRLEKGQGQGRRVGLLQLNNKGGKRRIVKEVIDRANKAGGCRGSRAKSGFHVE